MKTKIYLILILIFGLISISAQSHGSLSDNNINRFENGKKQGIWKAFDLSKHLMMVCEYKNDSIISDTDYYIDSLKIMTLKNINTTKEIQVYRGNDTLLCFMKKDRDKTLFVNQNNQELDKNIHDWIFEHISIQAAYIEGNDELIKFIENNIDISRINGKKGLVKVQFVIDQNGYLINPKIVEKDSKLLNEEALRVISLVPRWIPGSQFGRFVKCLYTIPINFK